MRTEQGFTLVEVLVTMVVLSLALLEIGRTQVVALRTTSRANRLSEATTLAQDRVERCMAMDYDDPLLLDPTPVGMRTTYTDAAAPAGYTVRWEVDKDNPIIDIKTIHVEVTWKSFGKTKPFKLSLQKEK